MARTSRPVAGTGPERFGGADALQILVALAQSSRLEVFRLLIRYLPYGLAAGDIAELLLVPHNTLSTHLAVLEQAGLVMARREGRSIIYAANRARALRLGTFLLQDCCGVTGKICGPPDSTDAANFCIQPNERGSCRIRHLTSYLFAPAILPAQYLRKQS